MSQRLPVGACQPTRFHHPHLVTRAETAIAAGSSLTITSIDRDACGVAALRTKATVMLPTTAARTAIFAAGLIGTVNVAFARGGDLVAAEDGSWLERRTGDDPAELGRELARLADGR